MKSLVQWGMIADRKFRRKILAIGTASHVGEVDAYDWSDERILHLNIDDYQTIILNFQAIELDTANEESESTKIFAMLGNGNMEVVGNVALSCLTNLHYLDQALQSKQNSETTHLFLIIGAANKFNLHLFSNKLLLPKSVADHKGYQFSNVLHRKLPDGSRFVTLFYDFFNKDRFKMQKEEKISMVNANALVQPYFEAFQEFDFVFTSDIRHTPLAHTFYNALLSFIIEIQGIDIIVLPHPKLTLPKDVTEHVLRYIIGLESEEYLTLPDWLENYQTMRQSVIKDEIGEIRSQIRFLEQQIEAKQVELDLIGEYQRSLFTHGELMRKSVFQLLDAMDVNIRIIDKVGSHDYEIETDTCLIVIQTYSMESPSLTRKVLRQLNQWVEEVEERISFSKKVKGLCLVNYQIKEDPIDRKPLQLDPTALNYIQKHGFCIMPTVALFKFFSNIYEQKTQSADLLIKSVIDTTGVLRMENLSKASEMDTG